MIFTPTGYNLEPEKLVLNGSKLPWVTEGKYLGNKIENRINILKEDTRVKRSKFIERNCELNPKFGFAHPEIKCELNQIYNSSFSGSMLLDFTSKISICYSIYGLLLSESYGTSHTQTLDLNLKQGHRETGGVTQSS